MFSIDGRHRATGRLLLRGLEPVGARELAARIATHEAGYLFQRRLAPHRAIAAAFGDRLWSVRLIVLLTADGPRVHRAVAKVPVGDNPADNYWRSGNLIGAVDIETGEIRRAVRGSGTELTVNPRHPDTGAEIVGVRLPNWAQTLDLTRAAAVLLPGIRTQSWDIALAEGPTLLEVNFGGDLNLTQLAWGHGVLDEAYRAHLEARGYPVKRLGKLLRAFGLVGANCYGPGRRR